MMWNRIAGILWRYMQSQTYGAQIGNGRTCELRPVNPFNLRCHLHGGLSTGPKTEAGRARIAEAQRQRWAQWRRERGLSPVKSENFEKSGSSTVSGPQEIDPEENQVPDPEGVDVEEYGEGGFRVTAQIWEHGNHRNRLARMHRIAWNLRFIDWRCQWCREPVPRYRRADRGSAASVAVRRHRGLVVVTVRKTKTPRGRKSVGSLAICSLGTLHHSLEAAMRSTFLLLAAILLTGCAASGGGTGLVPLTAPDGSSYYRVKCKGTEQECLTQANQACGGPYRVITSESHAGGILADALPGPVTWYSMHFQCGPSDGSIPRFPRGGPTFEKAWESYQDRMAKVEAARQANQPSTTTCTGFANSVTCVTQ